MSPETEAFLESVRAAEDPTLADEDRVLRALQATLAAGAVVGSGAAGKVTQFGAWSVAGGFKGAAVIVGSLAIGGLAAVHWGATSAERAPASVASLASVTLPVPAVRPVATAAPEGLTAPPAAPVAPAPKASPAPALPERALRAATAPPAQAPASASAAGLRAELELLARAQAALRRGDGAAALSTLDAAPARHSQLGAERATLRILALCALGRVVEAQRAAALLERSEPGSLQRDVISRSCAGGALSPR